MHLDYKGTMKEGRGQKKYKGGSEQGHFMLFGVWSGMIYERLKFLVGCAARPLVLEESPKATP